MIPTTPSCLMLLAGMLFPMVSAAAEPKRVRFDSVDGVRLEGIYHAARHRSPCVLLLHDLDQAEGLQSWEALAGDLHREGFAVLAFDFRGHGGSRTVDQEEFWSAAYSNRFLVKGRPREEIEFRDYDPRYHSVLVNDIAAAKAWLDNRNDDRECNTSSLIIMGAGEGAALGAAWVNSEWHRFEMRPPAIAGLPPRWSSRAEGSHILCAAWLSIPPRLGSRIINWPALVDVPGRSKTPMVFLHAADDRTSKDLSRRTEQHLLSVRKERYTGCVEVRSKSSDSPCDLLDENTRKDLIAYLKDVSDDRGREWTEQDFRDATSAWRLPPPHNRILPAHQPGDRNLLFSTYEAFLPGR